MTNNISENPREQHPDIPQFAREKRGATLKDSCVLIMGQSPSSNTYNTSGDGLPFYQGNADFGEENPVPRSWCTEPKKIAEKGDILISVRAPIGAINIADEKCCIGRGVAAIRPNQEVMSTAFLQHQLFASRSKLEAMGTGSTFKAIGKKTLSDFPVVTYPMNIQEAIAQQLSLIKKQIKTANSRLDQLDSLVKSRFVEMFGNLTNNDKGWSFVELASVCDVRDGTHDSPKYCEDGYPLMTSKNFSQGFADFSSAKFISKDDFDAISKRSKVDVGDIVMPMIGTIGHPVIVDTNRLFAIKNVALLKMNNAGINRTVLKCLLESDYFSQVVESHNRGATQRFISLNNIRGLEIPVIPICLQQEFADFVSQVDKLRFESCYAMYFLCAALTLL